MTTPRRTVSPPSRAWALFYPVVIAAAIGVILLSFGPAPFARPGDPVRAQASPEGLILTPAALAEAKPDAFHVVHVVRGSGGAAVALRLAVTPTGLQAGEAGAGDGVVLSLAPETATALAGKPVTATFSLRPILNSPAKALAVRLVGDTPGPWTIAAIPPPETLPGEAQQPKTADQPQLDDSPRAMAILLPAAATVRGFAIRALADPGGLNYGVEIGAVTLAPAP